MNNLRIPSSITERKLLSSFILELVTVLSSEQVDNVRIKEVVNEAFKKALLDTTKPLMQTRELVEGALPETLGFNKTNAELCLDLNILYQEFYDLADAIVGHFNYGQVEKNKLLNKVKELNEMVTDYQILTDESVQEYYSIKETFNDKKCLDVIATKGTVAHISTKEGIATLRRSESKNMSLNSSVKQVDGNGELGNSHVIRVATSNYLIEDNPHDKSEVVLDDKPDTWFEYQRVNIPEAKKIEYSWYDLEWAQGAPLGDTLRFILTLELNEVNNVNWLTINPYLPPNSTSKINIYSISTSKDGIDFAPLYEKKLILNNKLNLTPDTYNKDDIYSSDNFDTSKFAQQGVWSFPTREAKYIQIAFEQEESYTEKIGHTYYKRKIKGDDGNELVFRIPNSEVSEEIRNGQPGEYTISEKEVIEKGIDVCDGWRYAIGIRDIGIYQFNFAEKSEIVTTRYATPKPIDRITLATNEKIPEQFLTLVKERNEWIKYYVSLDDVNWYPISPMHHQRVGDTEIPPQIYLVNSPLKHEELEHNPNRGFITAKDASSLRLKIIFSRPTSIINANSYTPILEDYILKLYLKEAE